MEKKTLGQLAEYVGGKIVGDSKIDIKSASTLSRAENGDISFLANAKYERQLKDTKASAVIVDREIECKVPLLIAEDPYFAFMQIMTLLHGHRKHRKVGISKRASIHDSAKIGVDCHIHDFAVIDENAKIGDGCIIYPGVYVGENVHIGNDSIVYANVVIYDGCHIGKRVIINACATIGQDGFGFATSKGKHHKIPHIGSVIIEDDVEVGGCCAIERGALGETVIGEGTKIADMVVIGHGTKIGAHCLLVAQVGISGSTTLGHHCILGGQVGVVGHINIGNNVTVAAQSGVVNNVPDGQTVLGSPAIDASLGRRAYSIIETLPDMKKEIKNLKEQIKEISEYLDSFEESE